MRTLIIARHGNTFRPGEVPTRVGARTDLPLTEEERARGIGRFLAVHGLIPTKILAAPLQRTLQTAQLAAEELGYPCPVQTDTRLTEIDYGPDENRTEKEVIQRLGRLAAQAPESLSAEEIEALGTRAVEMWNTHAVVPSGWSVDPAALAAAWQDIADSVSEGQTLLCVSSNGTIRFAPVITGDYAGFCRSHAIKIPTGGICIFTAEPGKPWVCTAWGLNAFKTLS